MNEEGESRTALPEKPTPQNTQENANQSNLDHLRKLQNAVKMNEMAQREVKKEYRAQGRTEEEVEELTRPVTDEEQQQFQKEIRKERNSLTNRVFGKVFRWFGID